MMLNTNQDGCGSYIDHICCKCLLPVFTTNVRHSLPASTPQVGPGFDAARQAGAPVLRQGPPALPFLPRCPCPPQVWRVASLAGPATARTFAEGPSLGVALRCWGTGLGQTASRVAKKIPNCECPPNLLGGSGDRMACSGDRMV